MLWVVMVVVAAVARPGAEGETVQVRFRLFERGAVVVPVNIGTGPARPFLIDTGASRSAVAGALVEQLGWTAAGMAGVATATGVMTVPLVRLGAASFAAGTALGGTALVVDGAALAARAPVDGLLGLDVLAARAFTIDYGRRTITWLAPSSPRPAGTRLVMTLADGRAMVTASSPPLRLLVDSGADEIVLFSGRGRPLPAHTPGVAVPVRTLAGQRLAWRVRLDRLDLGDVSFRDQLALISDGAAPEGVDGLLPLHLFQTATIDGPGRLLIVTR